MNVTPKKNVYFPALLVFGWLILLAAIGCEKPDPQNGGNDIEESDTITYTDSNLTLQNTKWKLVGIFDAATDTLVMELEPKGCKNCYTIVFNDTEDTIALITVYYSLRGACEIDYETNTIHIISLIGIGGSDSYDGEMYLNLLGGLYNATKSFSLQANEFKWYYNDKNNYLRYKTYE